MTRLDILPRFLIGWDESFVIKCIICSSDFRLWLKQQPIFWTNYFILLKKRMIVFTVVISKSNHKFNFTYMIKLEIILRAYCAKMFEKVHLYLFT